MSKADYACCAICDCKCVYSPNSEEEIVCMRCYRSKETNLEAEIQKRVEEAFLSGWEYREDVTEFTAKESFQHYLETTGQSKGKAGE